METRRLIVELRNYRDPEENWPALKALIAAEDDSIVRSFSLRWLCSICDTYVDYGDPIESRNAMTISMFVNLFRLAETTRFLYGNAAFDDDAMRRTRVDIVPLVDELTTFAIDRQDTFLNVSKRMARILEHGGILEKIWHEMLTRLHDCDNIIALLRSHSAVPQRYFPVNPDGIKDNYGL